MRRSIPPRRIRRCFIKIDNFLEQMEGYPTHLGAKIQLNEKWLEFKLLFNKLYPKKGG